MKQFETIQIEKEDQITTITLNRPEKKNCMNPQLHFEMCDILEDLTTDPETRVLVLTGAGDSFCAGQDLKEFFYDLANDPKKRTKARRASSYWREQLLRLFPAPTIAAINGYCFGGGFGLVAACDLAIAADEAVFGLSEINWGIFPGSTLPKAIPELIPFRDAMYYTLTGKTFDGKKAAEIRFVNVSVPRSQLRQAVTEMARELIAKDPAALKAAKEVFKIGRYFNYEEMGAWSDAMGGLLRSSTDQRWKKGVEQFKSGNYRPGLGSYQWQQEQEGKK